MKFGSLPYPTLVLHLGWHFGSTESFSLGALLALRCRTHGQSRPRIGGLVPLVGKALVTNISVPLGFVLVPNALAMACLTAVASLLTILPSPTSQFHLLALYYQISQVSRCLGAKIFLSGAKICPRGQVEVSCIHTIQVPHIPQHHLYLLY